MFFVDIRENVDLNGMRGVEIEPSRLVQPKKLGRWNFFPYKKSIVEAQYLFDIAKSTFIVPFQFVQPLKAFIPCEFDDNGSKLRVVDVAQLLPQAAKHMAHLQGQFLANLKPGAAHKSLFEIINYQNCLVNPRQMERLKVAYNGGGSIVKGVLIEGPIIVDYSMFYCPVRSVVEGHYLLAFLNAPVVTESVKLIGSTGFHGSLRNIVKHPFDFPWPLFNRDNSDHVEIAKLAAQVEERVKKIIHGNKIGIANHVYEDDITRMKIQNSIFADSCVKRDIDDIDSLVVKIINHEITK